MSPKVFMNDRFIRYLETQLCFFGTEYFYWFYKAFCCFEKAVRKCSVGNAFSIILEHFFDFGFKKSSFPIGFIRFCHQESAMTFLSINVMLFGHF